ncbi:MAG TPA: vitamin B12-dependent ribonucleotide reductase [Verrucomicrobiae bacterium]|nr:vitamin B12-dependent ribonucleotide reductase [Verrucomicrobiae bacterium]
MPKSSPLVTRVFTDGKTHPFDTVSWEKRTSKIINEKGDTIFELKDAEIPSGWSQLATDIVVSKYFRKAGVPETGHEVSVRQVVTRIAKSIREAGEEFGNYFDSKADADAFEDELTAILVTQRGAFNSPVWFNCGLHQRYGILGAKGNWFWDFDEHEVRQLEHNYVRPQCSACFIQSAEDDLMKMFDLIKAEATLFKYGSGTGSNFSKIRGSGEMLSGGGLSSGLLSFLKVFDAAAGSIKSGGTTRRAAKMVCLDMDHPEIQDFINWKVREERKVSALVAAGYSSDFNGEAYGTVTAQNSNNSVRVSDDFMERVMNDEVWNTIERTTGNVAGTYQAKDLWRQICEAAWQCADPGVQYDTTINDWHTSANTDRINASNPCSEYMFLDDTACNLASINLVKFVDEDGRFDIDGYRQAIRVLFVAQEILVDFSSYPTQAIAKNSHDFRPLGLGYANLGTLLMTKGIAYDSPEAFAITGALTAILTGKAYVVSAEMAARKGAFNGYALNEEPMLRVMRKHRDATYVIDKELCPPTLLEAAQEDWEEAVTLGEKHGYRNAQATVIAPTGTIGLLMDCDTTSIEPDFALVKFKKLAGGGHFKIVNQSVPQALANLGYAESEIDDIITYATGTGSLKGAPFINWDSLKARGVAESDLKKIESQLKSTFELAHVFNTMNISTESLEAADLKSDAFSSDMSFDFLKAIGFTSREIEEANKHICGMMTVEGAPHLKDEHLSIFDCANKCGKYGTRFIEPMGHVRIMAAAQPFISGAISKTVNLPHEATVEEISEIYFQGWKLGLKAIAMYRDGSKLSQPLNSAGTKDKDEDKKEETGIKAEQEAAPVAVSAPAPLPLQTRRKLSDERQSLTHKFSIAGHKGYITVGLYEDGKPGEIFITMAKQGTTLSGLIDSFATAVSIALQYGVPLEVLVNKFSHVRFEPSGMTNNPNIRIAKSIVDYIFRWMGMKFLDRTAHEQIGYNNLPKNEDLTTDLTVSVPVDTVQEKAGAVGVAQAELNHTVHLEIKGNEKPFNFDTASDAPVCGACGGMTTRNGACYVCRNCGGTTGCS